jgi:ABC-2 type transport system ATP-binding protein
MDETDRPGREKSIAWLGGEYYGEISDSVPHGKGNLILPDGTRYEGDWKEGKPHGRGIVTYPSGGVYGGEIKEGKRDGYGKYLSPDGKTTGGLWQEGKFIKPLTELQQNTLEEKLKAPKDVIRIESLSFVYRSGKGIFDLTFSVGQGEAFGFLGPNGAGKTTTIRNLLGFTRPTKGRCLINDLDCWRDSALIQQGLGYLPGEITFFDEMTGTQFLNLITALRGDNNKKRREGLLDRFELDPAGRIRRMSKGMKQKLGIVTAFMHDPAVYILDEPTSGLDPLMQNEFVELVLEEKERGKTFLMSSHNFEETYRTCDRAGIIREGQLVAVEDVHSLKSSQRKTYLVTLALPDEIKHLRSAGLELGKISKNTVEVIVKDNYDQFTAALSRCNVTGLDVVTQGLEQLFLKYYGQEALPW